MGKTVGYNIGVRTEATEVDVREVERGKSVAMTPAELENYGREGFLIRQNFVSAGSCDALRGRAQQLVRAFDPAGVVSIFSSHEQTRTSDDYFLESGDKIRFFFEENAFNPDGTLKQSKDQSINKIGHALHDLDPAFDRFSRTGQIKELVFGLGIENPLLLQSMYIFKQPHIGGEVTCHQDATFLFTEPLKLVGLWFALEDATIENGCLWAIPGGHKLGLKSRFVRGGSPTVREGVGLFEQPASQTRFEVLDTSPWPEEELVPLEVRKGTLIVLHPLLPHLSRENRSAKSRHAFTLHIIDASVKYPEENWLQRAPEMPLRGF
jgi:phytanoyl-CoA hydroxylase